jgi:hypothetical protein
MKLRDSISSVGHAPVRLAWSANRSRLTSEGSFEPADAGDPLTRDELFAALEGRSVNLSRRMWQIAIYSIYDQQRSRWLQLRLDGRPQHTLTLRVPVDASVDNVMEMLTHWLNRAESATPSVPGGADVH